jgi:hypothetical protein
MTMFKFDINTVVEPAVKSAKTFSGMITAEPVKTAVDAVIDANASFVKAMFTACQDYSTTVTKTAK